MAKAKSLRIAIRNQLQSGNVLELFFLDYIYDYFTEEWTYVNMVQDVIERVRAANPSKVICWLNSEGGSCDIGIAVYVYLKYINVDVEMRGLAMVGSIATVIFQAATKGKRYIAKSAQMVIHKAWGYGGGTADELRQQAEVLDGYTAVICGVYADATGKPIDEIQGLIAGGDYWMTGEMAVQLGFADATFDEIPEGFTIENSLHGLDEHYVNVPEALKPFITTEQANQTAMTFQERMTEFLNSLKSKKINNATGGTTNLAEEVTTAMTEPLTQFMDGLHSDVQELITGQQAAITTAVNNALKTQVDTLTTAANTTLQTTFNTLQTDFAALKTAHENVLAEIATLKGGEVTEQPKNQGGKAPIGRGTILADA